MASPSKDRRYFLISISPPSLSSETLLNVLEAAVQQTYGITGLFRMAILTHSPTNSPPPTIGGKQPKFAVIRIHSQDRTKLRTSLTVLTTVDAAGPQMEITYIKDTGTLPELGDEAAGIADDMDDDD